MLPVEELLQKVVEDPNPEQRKVLADLLRSEGEADLADAVEGQLGASLLGEANELARQVRMHLGIRLLWCAYHVLPRLQAFQSPIATRIQAPNIRGAIQDQYRTWRHDIRQGWIAIDEEPAVPADVLARVSETIRTRNEIQRRMENSMMAADAGLISRATLAAQITDTHADLDGALGTPLRVREGDAPRPDANAEQYRNLAGRTFNGTTAGTPRTAQSPIDQAIKDNPTRRLNEWMDALGDTNSTPPVDSDNND